MRRRSGRHPAAYVALVVGLCTARASAAPDPEAVYVGGASCTPCHREETARWRGSHHDLAMQPATEDTVLGRFEGTTFEKDGVTSTFFRRDGSFHVRTDGPDGALREYRVAYTFGVDPLQQYLVEYPGGRFQALGIAWDARPAADGGQRWFDLHPGERIDHDDPLHWTGPAQNWNYMCAECHSTNVAKNYREATDDFATTWTDVDVGCEACHGPGSRHVGWAEAGGDRSADASVGLVARLADTSGGRWLLEPGHTIARRTRPRSSQAELETCGRCHARRAELAEGYVPGEPLAKTHRVSLLDADLYYPDGQLLDEVFEYGSFLQTKMHAAGVTCSDCHDPHSLRLRAPNNGVCVQCHLPTVYDAPSHHHHVLGTAAARCTACHMRERLYMVVDGRHDHGFRVPRPDLSERLGTPNACNDCHRDRTPRWAADAIAGWAGPDRRPAWHWGEAIHAGRTYRVDAEAELLRALADPASPAIVRATALSLLPPYLSAQSLPQVARGAEDPDPLVRRAAAGVLQALPPEDRVRIGVSLLRDPMLSVRLEALAGLVDLPREQLDDGQRAAFDAVVAEDRTVQAFNADRAEARVSLGMLEARLGAPSRAAILYGSAIHLQPSWAPSYLHLADLQRSQGHEAEAEATLRRGLAAAPDVADLHLALGLSLVRQRRMPEALAALERAAALGTDTPDASFVYAVALHDGGDAGRAIDVLARTHDRFPGARDVLRALAQYEAERGDRVASLERLRQLAATGDGAAAQVLQALPPAP